MKFSVVIPTYNEGAQIGSALRRLRAISQVSPIEIIVVDGASEDDTVARARGHVDELVVLDRRNRGAQLDAGAQKAKGDLLFFLDADVQPPGNWQQALERFWLMAGQSGAAATVFSVDYGSGRGYRFAAAASNWSAAWRQAPGAEHGFCTTPELYRRSGGFPPLPAMEDLVFAERLRKLGRIVVLKERIWPAARRMHSQGPVSSMLALSWRRFLFRMGADPESLVD